MWFHDLTQILAVSLCIPLSQVIGCQSAGAKIQSFFFPTNLFWTILVISGQIGDQKEKSVLSVLLRKARPMPLQFAPPATIFPYVKSKSLSNMKFRNLFNRKPPGTPQEQASAPQPLTIEGIPQAPLTPEPDDAELAAQALLEMMAAKQHGHRHGKGARLNTEKTASPDNEKEEAVTPRTATYYRHLARKMREARETTRLRVSRFLAFVEQELKKPNLPTYGDGSLGLLEAELYKRIDIVEREGGELKRRWQHCLALVTVRLMDAARNGHTDDTDSSSTTESEE